ncbi:MAG TPA: LuxR C-terminal-related transcriptional regulator [Solirubrobacteraceae bacterium]|nr:LuxR C-terminal-related transcriptional regulator [Solirubrobacteraceae bacterium]
MLGGGRRPVLIVQVDVGETTGDGSQASRCDVRMVPSVGQLSVEEAWASAGDGVSAVVILRNATPSSVFSCVRAAAGDVDGGGPALAGQLLPDGLEERQDPPMHTLSDREFDVLRMLADGESTRGIAQRLNYSERTVKNVVHDLLAKMGCRTRAHAVALATRQGVI